MISNKSCLFRSWTPQARFCIRTLSILAVPVICCAQAPLPDSFNPGANDAVYSLVFEPDGKVLAGGNFTAVAGQPRDRFARLEADGSLDDAFNPGPYHDSCLTGGSFGIQTDRKILVAKLFTGMEDPRRSDIVRFNPDGTLDNSFKVEADWWTLPLIIQPDNKILVGGAFTNICGQSRNHLARLNPDGTLDNSFNVDVDERVFTMALQPDGKIVIGGCFSNVCAQPRSRIARLNADGTLDSDFNASADEIVFTLAVQADNKILVGGGFTNLCGTRRHCLGRLNADGTLDNDFSPVVAGTNYPNVVALAVQADGKILVGGNFTDLAGQARTWLGRLNPDGTLDSGFDPALAASPQALYQGVFSLALQPDGKALVGGSFNSAAGQPRDCIVRLNSTEPATYQLSYNGSTITWLRGGTSPEVWRTTFDLSTNGLNWTSLGAGSRIPGGWALSGVTAPASSTILARGFLTGGTYNNCPLFVEAGVGRPAFTTQPFNHTNRAGGTVMLSVAAIGSTPLGFQWLRNGAPLTDTGNITGAQTAILTVSNVLKIDEAGYSVVVTNSLGSITSRVAALTVLDPWILTQPASQERDVGQNVTFQVAAAGTPPIRYQWCKEAIALAGATNDSLTLTNLRRADAGNYSVVVSNSYGSVTSAVAVLSINLGLVDSSFNPCANDAVFSLAHQADGKILAGGSFTILGNRLGRLNPDGTLDIIFNPWANDTVYALAVQPDGRILAAGDFTTVGGLSRERLVRLFPAGTVDENFNPGANGSVFALALQDDGKILLAGRFTLLGGAFRNYIGRLNADGTLDGFAPWVNDAVGTLAVQPDGCIVVGGDFTAVGGEPHYRLARLLADGTVDSSFNPAVDDSVFTVALQADGKILIGGWFSSVNGQPRTRIARLHADGTLDQGFALDADGDVSSLTVQTDGKILAGGFFTTMGGQPRSYLARLNADGTLDEEYDPAADSTVFSLAMQADGKTVVGGLFNSVGGRWRPCIARLNNTEPAIQSLSRSGATVTWLRGGASPEVGRTSFESSADGVNWISLGAGSRIPGGWELNGASLSTAGKLRARGYVTGGQYNGSTWFVEQCLNLGFVELPRILTDDGVLGFTDRQFGFNVQALPNQVVVIEGSSDFVHWSALRTNIHGAAPILFRDPDSTNLRSRFYRARLLQ